MMEQPKPVTPLGSKNEGEVLFCQSFTPEAIAQKRAELDTLRRLLDEDESTSNRRSSKRKEALSSIRIQEESLRRQQQFVHLMTSIAQRAYDFDTSTVGTASRHVLGISEDGGSSVLEITEWGVERGAVALDDAQAMALRDYLVAKYPPRAD